MARQFICQQCRSKDYDENMIIVDVGKQRKRYHKEKCHNEYLEDQKFKNQEKKEFDNLIEAIKKIHEIGSIPNQFFSYIQDIRNGNELFGKIGQKKSKNGYNYKIIELTYLECQDSIDWAMNNVDFKGDTFNLLKYTAAIIKKKVAGVSEIYQRKKQQEKVVKEKSLMQSYDYNHVEFNHKDKEDEQDISEFL